MVLHPQLFRAWVSDGVSRVPSWSLGVLPVGSQDFNFWGFYMHHSKEAKRFTFRRASEVGQGVLAFGFRFLWA